jgi:hypothetical protein
MVQWAISSRRVVLGTYRFFGVAAKAFSVIVFTAIWGAFEAFGAHRYYEGFHTEWSSC